MCGEFAGYVVGGNVGEGIIRRALDAWIGETACQQRFCFAKKYCKDFLLLVPDKYSFVSGK